MIGSRVDGVESSLNNFLKKNNISISSAVDSYIEMCTDMFSCHIKFLRTGKYPVYDVKEARRKVYNNHKKMKSYFARKKA